MSARNARDLAYHTVRSRIITMELKPGDPLNDRELAEELGISRTPMREALILLNNAHMCVHGVHQAALHRGCGVRPCRGLCLGAGAVPSAQEKQLRKEPAKTSGFP